MSEEIAMYRELAEVLFPDIELSDEEIVRIGLVYAKGYRDGYTSVEPPPKASATKDRVSRTGKGE